MVLSVAPNIRELLRARPLLWYSTSLVALWVLNGIRLVRKADRNLEECNARDWKIQKLARPAYLVRWINAGALTPWFADAMLWCLRVTLVQPAVRKSLRLMTEVENLQEDQAASIVPSILCNADARNALQQRLDEYYHDLRRSESLTQFGKILNYAGAHLCLTNHYGLLALGRHIPAGEETVVEPVIITSSPRTGTTILHRTMALDRNRFRNFDLCDMICPLPRPIPRWDTEGRQRKAQQARSLMQSVSALYPGWLECLETMHGFRPDEADEDLGWYDSALG